MKLTIKYTFNGKPVSNIEDALNKAVFDAFKNGIEEKLKPFKDAAELEGGEMTVDIKENLKADIAFSNISDELKTKILESIA